MAACLPSARNRSEKRLTASFDMNLQVPQSAYQAFSVSVAGELLVSSVSLDTRWFGWANWIVNLSCAFTLLAQACALALRTFGVGAG